jgi:hypothetical protein
VKRFQSQKAHSRLRWIWTKRSSFSRRKVIFFVQWLIFSRKLNHFFVWSFFSRKKSRYFDCNKDVNRRWFKRWCIVKRKQVKDVEWWDFFLHYRFRDNILFKAIEHVFSYWYSVVLLLLAIHKYLQRDRTIRHIKLSFFFLRKSIALYVSKNFVSLNMTLR